MKLFIKVILIVTILTGFNTQLYGQNKISRIVFEYANNTEMNPEFSEIKIIIQQSSSEFTLDLFWKSMGLVDRVKMEGYRREVLTAKTKEDSIKVIENKPIVKKGESTHMLTYEQYKKIAETIGKIDTSKILDGGGYDGYTCSIQYGNYSNYIKYSLHSPGHNSKKSANPNFSEACKLILEAAEIKPRKIL